jgi:hypothetical protein
MTAALAAGVIDLVFAAFHVLFWRLFGWPQRLQGSGPLNTAVTQTMNVILIYLFTAYGAGLIHLAHQPTGVHAVYALAGAGGWGLRTALQFVYFPVRDAASLALTAVFVVAAVLHGLAAWPQLMS